MASEVPTRRFVQEWLRDGIRRQGVSHTLRTFTTNMWAFLRDSTPSRRRQRYGDMDYDRDFRVDTTSGTVGWRERLLGAFHSPYQPTEPALFHEMVRSLEIEYASFTFIDLGSGKGRTLLMAAEYKFQRIAGVEFVPGLHAVAMENLRKFSSPAQKCFALESLCEDARQFQFPAEPTVLYLFNPLPEAGLADVMRNLMASLRDHPRPIRVLYHNPLLRHVIDAAGLPVRKTAAQYLVYSAG